VLFNVGFLYDSSTDGNRIIRKEWQMLTNGVGGSWCTRDDQITVEDLVEVHG